MSKTFKKNKLKKSLKKQKKSIKLKQKKGGAIRKIGRGTSGCAFLQYDEKDGEKDGGKDVGKITYCYLPRN